MYVAVNWYLIVLGLKDTGNLLSISLRQHSDKITMKINRREDHSKRSRLVLAKF